MIERNLFENWISVTEARKLVDEFFTDRETYPNFEFYSRKRGINKDIPDELSALLLFAESLSSATSLCLSPDSLPSPDGAVLLDDGSEITVQVTLSKERRDGYKKRLSLRDRTSLRGSGTARDINEVIAERLERIIDAIRDKETNFHVGTEILLVVDESIPGGIDPGLPNAIQEEISSFPPSKYSATYIIFNDKVRQIS